MSRPTDPRPVVNPKPVEPDRYPDWKDDAWHKRLMLYRENNRTWEPRPDLKVEALGCERAVRVGIADGSPIRDLLPSILYQHWNSTTRNISTMRELAQAILDACDFVEAVNPKWATHE